MVAEEQNMPRYLGLDGFRGGWVAAWIDDRGDHGFDPRTLQDLDGAPGRRRLGVVPLEVPVPSSPRPGPFRTARVD